MLSFTATGRKRYCDIVLTKAGLFGTSVVVSIRTGEDKWLSDYIKSQDAMLNRETFGSPVDVINYMAGLGWDLAAAGERAQGHERNPLVLFKEIEKQQP